MDFVSSMFPFDQTDELFQFSSIPCQHHKIQQDELRLTPYPEENDLTKKPNYRRRQKSSAAFGDSEENPNENKKKILHRDLERQRRVEMGTLYDSLRSLLPLEYLKGKRSISDHMHESVNYIKHLQKKIEELSDKRDVLIKRLSNSNTLNVGQECSQSRPLDFVTVKPCWAGVEVVMSCALTKEEQLPLSRVLQVIIKEGLSIVSCISTKVNERLLHTIESEVSDGRKVNLSELQQKLRDLIYW
nr:basic helix-loop-helix transcription factor [Loropetalum chinense var. rubrum]